MSEYSTANKGCQSTSTSFCGGIYIFSPSVDKLATSTHIGARAKPMNDLGREGTSFSHRRLNIYKKNYMMSLESIVLKPSWSKVRHTSAVVHAELIVIKNACIPVHHCVNDAIGNIKLLGDAL